MVTLPGALPTLIRSASGGRQLQERLDRQAVVHDHVGPPQHLVGAHREEAWIPRPGAHEEDRHPSEPRSEPAARRRRARRGRGAGTAPRSRGARATRPTGRPSVRSSRPSACGEADPASQRVEVALDLASVAATMRAQLGDRRRGGELSVAVAVAVAPDADVAEPELAHAAAVHDQRARPRWCPRRCGPLVDPLVAQPLGHLEHLFERQPDVALVRGPAVSSTASPTLRSHGASRVGSDRRVRADHRRARHRSDRPASRGRPVATGRPPSTTAKAPAGREQSPPSSARNARSASTHRRVGSCSIAPSRRAQLGVVVAALDRERRLTDLREHRVGVESLGEVVSRGRGGRTRSRPRRWRRARRPWRAGSACCRGGSRTEGRDGGASSSTRRRSDPVATSAPSGRSARVEPDQRVARITALGDGREGRARAR